MGEYTDFSEGVLRTWAEKDEVLEDIMAKILPPVVKLELTIDEE